MRIQLSCTSRGIGYNERRSVPAFLPSSRSLTGCIATAGRTDGARSETLPISVGTAVLVVDCFSKGL